MIHTKYGFFEWSNGYVHLFILEQNRHTFNLGVETDNLDIIVKSACLIFGEDSLMEYSLWPNQVRDKLSLINKIKEIRRDKREAPELFEGTMSALNSLTGNKQ